MRIYSFPALLAAAALCTGLVQAHEPATAPMLVAQSDGAVMVARPGKIRVAAVRKAEMQVPVESPTDRLSDAELALANGVQTGTVACEQGGDVQIIADPQNPGFFHITASNKNYYMHPVVSQTGALRLEDTRASAMWLQLGNKSMLLDQKLGRRAADGCVTQAQQDFAARMQRGLLGN